MLTKFNEQAQKVIVIAESIAFDLGHLSVGSEHLLLSLLKCSHTKLKEVLKPYNVTDEIIKEDIIHLFGQGEEQPFYMEYSEVVKDILEEAIILAKNTKMDKVTVNLMCVSLLQTKECVAVELLKKYNVDIEEVIFRIKENSELESKLDQISSLNNLNKKVKNNTINIVGRDKEIEQIITILSKKEKNNALIIGEAGVGKSALVEKLAFLINEKNVPKKLEKTLIYELSLAGIVSGTKYRGEFEEKLKKLIDQIKGLEHIVLFIDEIHNLIGAGGAEGAIDASNILKPYLARKDITIIGATTTEEYYRYFEKDQAMNRRFSIVFLKENSKEETKEILYEVKDFYQNYHNIKIADYLIDELVQSVANHIKQRTFPDKALDILDLACVKASLNNETELSMNYVINSIEEYTNTLIKSNLSFSSLINRTKNKIIGQDHVVDSVFKTLENKKSYKQPDGVFLFLGSTGVGKTQLANELASNLNRPLIKLDMSEYRDSSSIHKILGAPPGFIGHSQPSLFLTKINNEPRSVILLDEMDKAHNDVKNIFLQVFDDGFLEDFNKRKIYFNDCIIIITSTLQSNLNGIGFKKDSNKKGVELYYSNEFINRLDEVCYFNTLSKEDVIKIIKMNTNNQLNDEEINKLIALYVPRLGVRNIVKKAKERMYSISNN